MNNRVNEIIEHANTYYQYATEHDDAADNYTTITDDHVKHYYNLTHPIADETYFGNPYTLPKTATQNVDSFNETEWLQQDGVIESWKYTDEDLDHSVIYVTVYVGQEELEFCLSAMGIDIELTDVETQWIERHTDWTVNRNCLYRMYPETCAIVEYHVYPEDD